MTWECGTCRGYGSVEKPFAANGLGEEDCPSCRGEGRAPVIPERATGMSPHEVSEWVSRFAFAFPRADSRQVFVRRLAARIAEFQDVPPTGPHAVSFENLESRTRFVCSCKWMGHWWEVRDHAWDQARTHIEIERKKQLEAIEQRHAQATLPTPQPEDRSAGRWCAVCQQHGSHHTDRHDLFGGAT